VALKDAQLTPATAATLKGDTLEPWPASTCWPRTSSKRLSNWMDIEALRVLANGLALNLDTLEEAEASAAA
jgi:DNA gyrase subunit B